MSNNEQHIQERALVAALLPVLERFGIPASIDAINRLSDVLSDLRKEAKERITTPAP